MPKDRPYRAFERTTHCCLAPTQGGAFGSCRAITYGADSFTSDLLPAGAILDF